MTPPDPAPQVPYTWDDNGNLVERGDDEFAWDYEDRLVEATVGATTTTFAYTGDGLRHSRTVGQDTTVFTWDIAAGLPVVLDDGDARYVYGATGLISQVTVADTYYYLPDGLGSTMVTTNSAGNVANAYTYDVFGAPRSTSGAQANEFEFAGEQVDASTGLQYLRARYYDFEVGRFISREPLAALPGWGGNPFGYANANPASLVDPAGEAPVDADGCVQRPGANGPTECEVENSCHWQRTTDPYGSGAWCDWDACPGRPQPPRLAAGTRPPARAPGDDRRCHRQGPHPPLRTYRRHGATSVLC